MRILVEAFGCTLNRGESDEFREGLLAMGHDITEEPAAADAFVIFTCGVIETTERHMLRRIREFSAEPEKPMVVCGCLVNICPEKILKIAPHATLAGTAQHLEGLRAFCSNTVAREIRRQTSIGILPVASGCSGACAYCITKVARGELCSRSPDVLLTRLEKLVADGAAEVQLCAQDTAVYGRDIGIGLADLIGTLENASGDFMIRIGMMNPSSAMADLEGIIKAFESPKVFKFLHLPVQSGSDAILERMNRRHTADDFRKIVQAFRNRFPGMSLSTDIIIGFPGETDEDFLDSIEMMREIKPDIINITRFSSRPGTTAHAMKSKVPGWKAKDRSRMLTELRFGLTGENYRGVMGRTVRALATERRVEGTTFMRTPEYKPVVVDGVLELGKWYDVTICGNARTHLCCTLENVK